MKRKKCEERNTDWDVWATILPGLLICGLFPIWSRWFHLSDNVLAAVITGIVTFACSGAGVAVNLIHQNRLLKRDSSSISQTAEAAKEMQPKLEETKGGVGDANRKLDALSARSRQLNSTVSGQAAKIDQIAVDVAVFRQAQADANQAGFRADAYLADTQALLARLAELSAKGAVAEEQIRALESENNRLRAENAQLACEVRKLEASIQQLNWENRQRELSQDDPGMVR